MKPSIQEQRPVMIPRYPDQVTGWLLGHLASGAPRGPLALEAARTLFSRLGDPQDRVPAVHIVGSAGKGTVAMLVSGALAASGTRVATHLSPHVYDVRERFLLDACLPGWSLVMEAVEEVAWAADAAEVGGPRPTLFAVAAALSAVIGRLAGTDIWVVEAGIGGRLDATNVFTRPDTLTVITPIGLDHTALLGPTVTAIAREKCAVMEGRTNIVMAPQPSAAAARVVCDTAQAMGARIHEVVDRGRSADWQSTGSDTAQVVLDLVGAGLDRSFTVEDGAPAPGRFEMVETGSRRLILDGAHSPMKISALSSTLTSTGVQPAAGVVALGASKDLAACAPILAGLAPKLFVTTFGAVHGELGPRGHDPSEISGALRWAGAGSVEQHSSPAQAATAAGRASEAGDTIVITGSFLHLAEARRALCPAEGSQPS